MSSRTVPPWIIVERGSAPIVLLAPHGGRRRDVRIPGEHKVNDLHTADVTRALARQLGASVVINEHVDRNELDLNRTSQVRRDAPWLVDVLAEMLEGMIAAAGRATVLVIHGWNVTQVACDVGIGMREGGVGLTPVRPGAATVSDAFLVGRLRPFQERAAAEGVAVTIGSRYPAAHPNNLLQMFRADGEADVGEPCPIAALCRTATIDAVQLELAIPLRWPGPRRDRFVSLVARSFGVETERPPPRSAAYCRPVLRAGAGRVTRRRGLQLTAGDLLLMTSIDAGDAGPVGGRVVVSESPTRLALFTGELVDPTREWLVPPLTCESGANGVLRFTYEGPLVTFPSHTPFLDLERGLADGDVVDARLDVAFEPDGPGNDSRGVERFGSVRGQLVIDGRRHAIATRGLATVMDTPVPTRLPHGRITLPCPPLGPLRLTVESLQPHGRGEWRVVDLVGVLQRDGENVAVRASGAIDVLADGGRLVLESADPIDESVSLSASLERIIPLRRPGRHGTVVETTFALLCADGQPIGWLELSVVHGKAASLIAG